MTASSDTMEEALPSSDLLNDKMGDIVKAERALSDVIEDLDKKLDRVLKKQEHEYLKGYSLYVKQKERELRELISKLNDKNSNASLKDQIIYEKTQTIAALTRE